MKVSVKKAAIEKKMALLKKELKSIENSVEFKRELAVVRALDNLMKKHGYSKNDVIALLQSKKPVSSDLGKKITSRSRKPRKLRVFKNPETNEIVKTRGGNHQILKAWKMKYGLNNINEWLVETKD